MDPPALINNGSFQCANATSSFNLSEIWPFSIDGGGLDLSRVRFGGESFGKFEENGNRDGSGNDPMVLLDQRETRNSGARRRLDPTPEDDSAKVVCSSPGNGINDCDGKPHKSSDENHESKDETEANSTKPREENAEPAEPPKQDYIHVRARRGQATDNHSLAERARREKISQRMKVLQDLVPGCNKVIGKALVLDEIINYIQSLQHQVEFLSMKLEAVNSRVDPNIEGGFPSKDFGQQTIDTAGVVFSSQATTGYYGKDSSPEWLHMQIGGSLERTT